MNKFITLHDLNGDPVIIRIEQICAVRMMQMQPDPATITKHTLVVLITISAAVKETIEQVEALIDRAEKGWPDGAAEGAR